MYRSSNNRNSFPNSPRRDGGGHIRRLSLTGDGYSSGRRSSNGSSVMGTQNNNGDCRKPFLVHGSPSSSRRLSTNVTSPSPAQSRTSTTYEGRPYPSTPTHDRNGDGGRRGSQGYRLRGNNNNRRDSSYGESNGDWRSPNSYSRSGNNNGTARSPLSSSGESRDGTARSPLSSSGESRVCSSTESGNIKIRCSSTTRTITGSEEEWRQISPDMNYPSYVDRRDNDRILCFYEKEYQGIPYKWCDACGWNQGHHTHECYKTRRSSTGNALESSKIGGANNAKHHHSSPSPPIQAISIDTTTPSQQPNRLDLDAYVAKWSDKKKRMARQCLKVRYPPRDLKLVGSMVVTNDNDEWATATIHWICEGNKYGMTVAHLFEEDDLRIGAPLHTIIEDSDMQLRRLKIGSVIDFNWILDILIYQVLPDIRIDHLGIMMSDDFDRKESDIVHTTIPDPYDDEGAYDVAKGVRVVGFPMASRGLDGVIQDVINPENVQPAMQKSREVFFRNALISSDASHPLESIPLAGDFGGGLLDEKNRLLFVHRGEIFNEHTRKMSGIAIPMKNVVKQFYRFFFGKSKARFYAQSTALGIAYMSYDRPLPKNVDEFTFRKSIGRYSLADFMPCSESAKWGRSVQQVREEERKRMLKTNLFGTNMACVKDSG